MQAKNLKDVLLLGNELEHVSYMLSHAKDKVYGASAMELQAGPYKVAVPNQLGGQVSSRITKDGLRINLQSLLVEALETYAEYLQDQLKELGVEYVED